MTIIAQTPAYATDATYGGGDTCLYNDTPITAGFAATAQNTILYLPTDGWSSGAATGIKIRWYRASDNSFAGETDFVVADGTGTVTKALNANFSVANGENLYPLMVSDGFVKLVTDNGNTFSTFSPTGTYASPPSSINPATDPGATRAKFRVALDGSGADTTAPSLTDGPNVSGVSSSGFDVGGTSDENGTAYLLVTAVGASQPADAAFDASTETAAMTAATPFSIHHTGQ